jgi:hypothetical protein
MGMNGKIKSQYISVNQLFMKICLSAVHIDQIYLDKILPEIQSMQVLDLHSVGLTITLCPLKSQSIVDFASSWMTKLYVAH